MLAESSKPSIERIAAAERDAAAARQQVHMLQDQLQQQLQQCEMLTLKLNQQQTAEKEQRQQQQQLLAELQQQHSAERNALRKSLHAAQVRHRLQGIGL